MVPPLAIQTQTTSVVTPGPAFMMILDQNDKAVHIEDSVGPADGDT